MKKNTSWGNVATWYKDHLLAEDSYHAQVIAPNLTRVIDIKPEEKILDLACGTGYFSEIFQSRGAQVFGVDISPELIALAKRHASSQITFSVAPAHETKLPSNSFDKIACVLAMQNIKEVREVLAECKRILKKSGKLYIVINHPAFRIPQTSSWGWENEKQYRRLDGYMSEKTVEIVMNPGKAKSEKTVSFHRPLQYYSKLLQANGLAITRIEEWISHRESEKGPRQKEEDRMRKEIPLFMLIEVMVY